MVPNIFDKVVLGNILIVLSVIPLGFLIYSLMNLQKLEITLTHPRVIVELTLFLILLLVGILRLTMTSPRHQ